MKNLKKISYLSFYVALTCISFVSAGFAQDRQRVVKTVSSRPINQTYAAPIKTRSLSSSTPSNTTISRPTLTSTIEIPVKPNNQPFVKKTGSSTALNAVNAVAAGKMFYSSSLSLGIMRGIQSRLGIPYLYGSSGPKRYDCSGFIWSVFNEAGLDFSRVSARSLWASGQPVSGDERYKFGTLVFLNGLGHIGIVADENGFYHASSSKGVTYSPFKGYWEKRVVGFRRLATPAPAIVE